MQTAGAYRGGEKTWSAWVAPGTPLNIVLIDTLRPQLRDPAVGAWRAAN
jgi:hypothetical protein